MDRTLKQIQQFVIFDNLLTKNAPEGFKPWYFPVKKEGKDPEPMIIRKFSKWETPSNLRMSWKADHARLTKWGAIKLIKEGYNIGISARKDDPLVIIDIDSEKHLQDMPADSLMTRSRRRTGLHGFFWKTDDRVKINIPTDQGEIRSCDQYVLCAGSYVPLTDKDIQMSLENNEITSEIAKRVSDDDNRGFYTVENKISPRTITYEELPNMFRNKHEKNEIEEKNNKNTHVPFIKSDKKHSALYDLKMSDIVKTTPGRREPHPLHPSDTGQNFSITKDGTLCHCWRHCVSLNPIQYLCVKSGYANCEDAGTPHNPDKKSMAVSLLTGDYGAVFHAWLEAKKMRLIPDDDKIPFKAVWYIAVKHKLMKQVEDSMPRIIQRKAIDILEREY